QAESERARVKERPGRSGDPRAGRDAESGGARQRDEGRLEPSHGHRLLAHRDVFAEGGELLRSQTDDAAQAIRGVEAAHAPALVDDAPGAARPHAREPRDLFHAGAVEVEGPYLPNRSVRQLFTAFTSGAISTAVESSRQWIERSPKHI